MIKRIWTSLQEKFNMNIFKLVQSVIMENGVGQAFNISFSFSLALTPAFQSVMTMMITVQTSTTKYCSC